MNPNLWPYLLVLWSNANANGTSTIEVVHHTTTADYILIGVMVIGAIAIVSAICRPTK